MERMHHRNKLMMSEAAYKGVHPQVVEMDRRPGGIIVGEQHTKWQAPHVLKKDLTLKSGKLINLIFEESGEFVMSFEQRFSITFAV